MSRAALLLTVVLTLCGCASTPAPRPAELAAALEDFDSAALAPTDLAHIACLPVAEEPSEFHCRWRQRGGGRWQDWDAFLARSGRGWQLIDTPSPRR